MKTINKSNNINEPDGEQAIHREAMKEDFSHRSIQDLINQNVDIDSETYSGKTALHYMCRNTNVNKNILDFFSTHDANFHAQDIFGKTPLHFLCENKSVNAQLIIKYLELSGYGKYKTKIKPITLKIKDNKSRTPLHSLCANPSFNYQMLIDLDKNIKDGYFNNSLSGNTMMHYLMKSGTPDLQLIQFFMGKQIDINTPNGNGETPLHFACRYSSIDIIQFLIKKGANITAKSKFNKTCLHYAFENEHLTEEIISFLLSKEINVNEVDDKNNTALHYACSVKNDNIAKFIELLLKNGADPNVANTSNEIPIQNLFKQNKEYLNDGNNPIKTLIIYKSTLDKEIYYKSNSKKLVDKGPPPIFTAFQYCFPNDIMELLKIPDLNCERIKYKDSNIIDFYLKNQNKISNDILRSLLSRSNSNYKNYHQYMNIACANPKISVETIEILYSNYTRSIEEYKKEINEKIDDSMKELKMFLNDRFYLHIACRAGNLPVVKRLYQLYPEMVNMKYGDKHQTILHCACKNPFASVELVSYLFEIVQNIEEEDIYGETAFHYLLQYNKTDISILELFRQSTKEKDLKLNKEKIPSQIEKAFKKQSCMTFIMYLLDEIHFLTSSMCKTLTQYCDTDRLINILKAHPIGEKEKNISSAYSGCFDNKSKFSRMTNLYYLITKYKENIDCHLNSEKDFMTPLLYSIQKNLVHETFLLLNHNANCNVTNNNGETALDIATKNKENSIIIMILTKINDFKSTDKYQSLIFQFIKNNDKQKYKAIIKGGINLHQKDSEGNTLLHTTCKYSNDSSLLTYLIEQKLNLNAQNKMKYTPLHIACENGNFEFVDILIKSGATITLKCDKTDKLRNLTPFHCACFGQSIKIIKYLELKGANIYEPLENGLTPFNICCKYSSSVDLISYFISKGVDINYQTKNGKICLHFLSKNNNSEAIKILLNKGADINKMDKYNRTPLYYACVNGRNDIAEQFLAFKPNVNVLSLSKKTMLYDMSPIHVACRTGNYQLFKILIQNGADIDHPNAKGETCFHFACKSRNLDLVIYLHQNGANINAITSLKKVPLHEACISNNDEIISYIIDNGGNVNAVDSKGNTPIFYAIKNKASFTIISKFIENKAKINIINKRNETPLYYAFLYNNINEQILEMFFQNGANPNIIPETEKGPNLSPLHIACKNDLNINIISSLISHGEVFNSFDCNGMAPIHYAYQYFSSAEKIIAFNKLGATKRQLAANGETVLHSFMRNLNDIKIDEIPYKKYMINSKTNEGKTPLHIACEYGNYNSIEYLLTKGADINACDNLNYTPLHYYCLPCKADKNSHSTYILRLLIQHGANVYARTLQRESALHFACLYEPQFIYPLMEADCEVNIVDSNENSPLHNACSNKNIDIDSITRIIHKGGRMNEANAKGRSPLILTCISGQEDMALTLIDLKADVNYSSVYDSNKTALHYACENGYFKLVRSLLHHGADPNKTTITQSNKSNKIFNETPLHAACENVVDIKIIELLLKFGADVSIVRGDGKTAVEILHSKDALDYIPILIREGASHTSNNESLLKLAIINANISLVQALLETNEDPNNKIDDKYPLYLACSNNSPSIIEFLISYGADPNKIDDDKVKQNLPPTPLMLVCSQGNANLAEILISKGADINIHSGKDSPLKYACTANSIECVKILLSHGASPNYIIDDIGTTAFSYVCKLGYKDIVNYFIEKSADFNLTTYGKWNKVDNTFHGGYIAPIHNAALSGSHSVVSSLIQNGANIFALTYQEYLPIHYACMSKKDHVKLVKYMIEDLHVSGMELTLKNEYPIEIALKHNNKKVTQYLISSVSHANKQIIYNKILSNKQPDIIERFSKLLQKEDAQSLFQSSIENIKKESYQLALQSLVKRSDINVDVCNSEGEPFIHVVVENELLNLFEILINRCVDIMILNTKGRTILEVMEEHNWKDGLSLLESL